MSEYTNRKVMSQNVSRIGNEINNLVGEVAGGLVCGVVVHTRKVQLHSKIFGVYRVEERKVQCS